MVIANTVPTLCHNNDFTFVHLAHEFFDLFGKHRHPTECSAQKQESERQLAQTRTYASSKEGQ